MQQLLHSQGGSVRKALAAYNAGPGNIGAGYGYADGILAAAKQPGGLTGSGGSAAGSPDTQLAGFNWITTPLDPLGLGWVGNIITGTSGTFATIGDIGKAISGLTRGMSKFLELFALLFRPEFWLRVGAFLFGLLALGAGVYFLKESLSDGLQ
jgi:hypothetical protein